MTICPKAVVSSKDSTALENRPSDALDGMVPCMRPILKQSYYYCFFGLPGKPNIIKKAHSSNFNRSFLACMCEERERMSILSVDQLRKSSSSMVAGTFNFFKLRL